MSARDFSKISPAIWRSRRFLGLETDAKLQFIYYATNEHVNSSGVYRLTDGYAVDDLGFQLDKYHQNRAILIRAGMIDFDYEHSFLMVEGWFKHNPPMNGSHSAGTLRLIEKVKSERLREKVASFFAEADTLRLAREAKKKADRDLKIARERIEFPDAGSHLQRSLERTARR
ncbi:hypothetical protein [Mesorhizobium amorphae]|uniref:hypothetical protein n=1 Tax=Mesorhizobium amorphae TaxID=71433 RepID=UPI00177E4151|nr:hypothetical protein [Mesorhizobium amorphae]